MSTSSPASAAQPYRVTDIRHERQFQPDGKMGGQYHVTIEHNGGVQSTFTVPEGADAAAKAHAAAMDQVAQTQQLKRLPTGVG